MTSVRWFSVVLLLAVTLCSPSEGGILNKPGKEYRKLKSGKVRAAKGLEYVPNGGKMANEPSCEELRAMWRFSKRQSRAAEMTNEIPQFRDPFYTNNWGPEPSNTRSRAHHYGRVVHAPPAHGNSRNSAPNKARAFEEVVRIFGNPRSNPSTGAEIRRRPPARKTFRVLGGGLPDASNPLSSAGSFQELREIIRNERMKDLQMQQQAVASAILEREIPDDGEEEEIVIQEVPVEAPIGGHFGRIVHKPPSGKFGDLVESPTAFETIRYGPSGRYRDSPIAQMAASEGKTRSGGFLSYPDVLAPAHGASRVIIPENEEMETPRRVVIVEEPSGDLKADVPSTEVGLASSEGFFGPIHQEIKGSPQPQYRVREASRQQPKCTDVENRKCSLNADCACQGPNLYRCSAGRCRFLSLSDSVTDRFGSWHSTPLDSSDLGLWQRRKRNSQKHPRPPTAAPL